MTQQGLGTISRVRMRQGNENRKVDVVLEHETMFLDAAMVTVEQTLHAICGDVHEYYIPIVNPGRKRRQAAYRFLDHKYYGRATSAEHHEFLKGLAETQMFFHYCDASITAERFDK